MKKLTALFSIIILICSCTAKADTCIVPIDLYNALSRHVLCHEYRDAERLVDDFIGEHPSEPSGPLLKAAVLQYAATDYEDFSRGDEFFSLIHLAEKLAEQVIDSDTKNLWAHYYLAAAHGLHGAWTVSTGKLVSGVIQGRSGAKGMEKIVAADSTFYDSYLMIGSYRFWKNVAIDRLSWLPFVEASINGSFDDVNLSISKGALAGPLSNTVLLEMLLERDPDSAIELGERLLADYPDCRLFAWQLGEAYKKLGRFDDAVRVFHFIAESMSNDEIDYGSGVLRCWWKLAVLSKTVGKHDKCVYYCNKVIEFETHEKVRKRQSKRIEKARKMLQEIKL